LPAYLKPGQSLLGKYKIVNVVAYNRIFRDMLMNRPSVFDEEYEMKSPVIGQNLLPEA